jgi:predicted metal-dependent hydrolase
MDRGATEGIGLIELGGRSVEYRFARRRRRTLGLSVDAQGLKVAAPLRAPWREIEGFLREKRSWILAKLDEWSRVPKPPLLLGMSGESLPLFGELHVLEVREGARKVQREPGRLIICAPRWRALETLVRWLKTARWKRSSRARAFRRAPRPRRRRRYGSPTRAAQWGVCAESGSIRLSWRLVHLAPALADYVVAHEVAHLVELNHSRRFWALVSRPLSRMARRARAPRARGRLLPVMKGRR